MDASSYCNAKGLLTIRALVYNTLLSKNSLKFIDAYMETNEFKEYQTMLNTHADF